MKIWESVRAALKTVRVAAICAVLAVAPALAGSVPNLPVSPTYSEASQIIATLNALINQLNGNPAGSGGYAAQPNNIVSLGAVCQAAGASPQTCNAQRGLVTFTGVTVTGNSESTVQINNSLITNANNCQANLTAFGGTLITNGVPLVTQTSAGTGNLQIVIGNLSATTTGSQSFGVTFNCVN